MSTDFLSTEMSPVKEANKTPAPPVIKKSLPEELYPGVPIAGAGSEAPALQAEEASPQKPPPTPEEKKVTERELAKVNAGAAIYGVALVLALILALGPYLKFAISIFEISESFSYKKPFVVGFLGLFALFPTLCSALAARIARWFVGSTTPERLSPYFKVFFAINGLAVIFLASGKTRLIFIIPEAISLVLTSAILTYNGGGFAKHCKKLLIHIFKK